MWLDVHDDDASFERMPAGNFRDSEDAVAPAGNKNNLTCQSAHV
jgi:hypothetical protein